jgi:mevalonate kinase
MLTTLPKTAAGVAHSKLILVGEHAVVYGKPAIAIPFPLEVRAAVAPKSGWMTMDCDYYSGPLHMVPGQLRGIAACIKETLLYLNKPLRGLSIKIDSSIPLGRGLGSSAAIAVAVVRGLFTFFGEALSEQKLLSFVEHAENYTHGTPSGIDMAAVISDTPIWFEKGKPQEYLNVSTSLYIVAADSGQSGDTRSAVRKVRRRYLEEPDRILSNMNKIEKIALESRTVLSLGDTALLGSLLDANHTELIQLGVSNENLDHLVHAAKKAGALGAKLTGGGLGGCIIALAQNEKHGKIIADELKEAGAANTWHFTTEYS